jgi:hypothetical protein
LQKLVNDNADEEDIIELLLESMENRSLSKASAIEILQKNGISLHISRNYVHEQPIHPLPNEAVSDHNNEIPSSLNM